jgi:thymidylate synthase (FAD)
MKIISPSVNINQEELSHSKLISVERYARTCYKSEMKDNNQVFLKTLIQNGHESVIEHEKVTVTFIVDRGISNQIIRHRIASYSQESTRYCNYSSDKFSNEITVIEPFYYPKNTNEFHIWESTCKSCENAYMRLCSISKPEEARSVLPTSLKTELVTTYNFREWRHFFSLRCSKKSHPQMRQVTIPLLLIFKDRFPALFDDINYDIGFPQEHYADVNII